MNPRPYLHPSAWKSEELSGRDDWIVHLDAEDIREIDQAGVKSISVPDDFVLGRVIASRRINDE